MSNNFLRWMASLTEADIMASPRYCGNTLHNAMLRQIDDIIAGKNEQGVG